jgi:dual oxidase maturation factor 1
MWLLMNLLLVVVPRYGAYTMMVTGSLLLSTDLVYYLLIPFSPLVVRFEGSVLVFRLGWCFWLVITAGDTSYVGPNLQPSEAEERDGKDR